MRARAARALDEAERTHRGGSAGLGLMTLGFLGRVAVDSEKPRTSVLIWVKGKLCRWRYKSNPCRFFIEFMLFAATNLSLE